MALGNEDEPMLPASPSASFHTASEPPDPDPDCNADTTDTTAQTSPSHDQARLKGATEATHSTRIQAPPIASSSIEYRAAAKLPRELRDRCKIYLEERMYLPAIQMLSSLAASGGHRSGDPRPAFVPPHQHLALIASLAIHPSFTNRSIASDGNAVGSLALHYLRALQRTVGPVNANMSAAFDFEPWRRQPRRGNSVLDGESDDEDLLKGPFVDGYVVFSKAESFWKLLGWAFNCSALNPDRWRFWHMWLAFVIDVLETDYKERERLDAKSQEDHATAAAGVKSKHWREGSLLFRYVCSDDRASGGDLNRSTVKAMLRAIFADGSESSLREFPQLFTDETKPRPAATGSKRKRNFDAALDLDNEQYGDWLDSDGGDVSPDEQPDSPCARSARKPRGKTHKAAAALDAQTPSEDLLGSVGLRLRLFHLLGVAVLDHSDRADGLHDLYSSFTLNLRSLHIDLFSAYLATHCSFIPLDCHVTLIRETLDYFQPKTAPKPRKVDPEAAAQGLVTVQMLVHCYLPFAAPTGVDSNARFSLLVESLTHVFWRLGQLVYTPELDEAVQLGVKLRNDCKIRGGARAKAAEDEPVRQALVESGRRLQLLIQVLRDEKPCDEDAVDEKQGTMRQRHGLD